MVEYFYIFVKKKTGQDNKIQPTVEIALDILRFLPH